jgi:hypothetical protein
LNKICTGLLVTSALLVGTPAQAAAYHASKIVSIVLPPAQYGGCMWFQLTGVTEADPIAAGNPWFAVPVTHPGYKEIFASLLAAKISEKTVTVQMTNATACNGYAAVDWVYVS